jgi:hypothetical protein
MPGRARLHGSRTPAPPARSQARTSRIPATAAVLLALVLALAGLATPGGTFEGHGQVRGTLTVLDHLGVEPVAATGSHQHAAAADCRCGAAPAHVPGVPPAAGPAHLTAAPVTPATAAPPAAHGRVTASAARPRAPPHGTGPQFP